MKWRTFVSVFLFIAVVSLATAGDLFQQAWDHAWRGEYKEAAKGYQKFAKSQSDHPLAPVALFNAASINMVEIGDLKSAEKQFEEVTEKYPNSKWAAESSRRLAEISVQNGDFAAALAYLQESLIHASAKGVDMPDSWTAEVVSDCQDYVQDLNDPDVAVHVYQELVKVIPPGESAAETHYHLALAFKAVDRSEEAAHTFADVMYHYPNSSWTGEIIQNEREFVAKYLDFPWEDIKRLRQAQLHSRQAQPEEVREIYQDIMQKFPGTPLAENAELGSIGAGVHLTGDFTTGLEELGEFIDKFPNGVTSREATDLYEVWEDIQRMEDRLEADPEDYGTHSELGFTLLRRRYLPLAESHFLEALKSSAPDDAYIGLGYVYSLMGRSEESIQYFERYLQNHPNEGDIYNRVGYAYIGLGKFEEALKCFEKFKELEPDNPNAYDSYAECLMNLGRYEESIAQYQRAIERNPDFTNPYFMLGEVYKQIGNSEKALEYYQQYIERDPSGFQSDRAQTQVDSLKQK